MAKNQIIGIVPFSFLAKDRFQLTRDHQSPKSLLAALFDERRIEFRFKMLEMLNAASFCRQTDTDFSVAFLTSKAIPTEHRIRLEEAISNVPGAALVMMPRMRLAEAVKRTFAQMIRPDADHVTTFRLDDDDALAMDYIADLRDRAARLISGGFVSEPMVASYSRGVYWRIDGARSQLIDISDRVPLSMGYAIISPRDNIGHHYIHGHRDAGMHYPTFMDPSRIMYIRSVHGDNDGGISNLKRGEILKPGEVRQVISNRFGLDPELFLNPPKILETQKFSDR